MRWRQRASIAIVGLASNFLTGAPFAKAQAVQHHRREWAPITAAVSDSIEGLDIVSAAPAATHELALLLRGRKRVALAVSKKVSPVWNGNGPMNFRSVAVIGWLADTLYVIDTHPVEVFLFARTGRLLKRLSGHFGGLADREIPLGLFSDHRLIAAQNPQIEGSADSAKGHAHVVTDNGSGAPGNQLTDLRSDHPTLQVVIRPAQTVANLFQPFSDDDLISLSGDGTSIIKLDRTVSRNTLRPIFKIIWIDRSGRTIRTKQYQHAVRQLNSRQIDSATTVLTTALTRRRELSSYGPLIRSQIRSLMYKPPWEPPVSNLMVGNGGIIWVQRTDLRNDWQLLSATGRFVAQVRVPSDVQILAVDGITIVGVRRGKPMSSASVILLRMQHL
jgi:hypothetical protein